MSKLSFINIFAPLQYNLYMYFVAYIVIINYLLKITLRHVDKHLNSRYIYIHISNSFLLLKMFIVMGDLGRSDCECLLTSGFSASSGSRVQAFWPWLLSSEPAKRTSERAIY